MLRTSTRRPIYSAHTRKPLPPSRRAVAYKTPLNTCAIEQRGSHAFLRTRTCRSDLLPMTRPETHQNLIHTDKEQMLLSVRVVTQPESNTTDHFIPTSVRSLGTKGPNRLLLCDDTGPAHRARTKLANPIANPLRSGGGERVRTDDPLLAKQVLSQLSYAPILVGQGGFEPPTPRLSSVCSNQLSY